MNNIKLYYFTIPGLPVTIARGENVKLMLVDAGLEHEYVRLPKGEVWAEKKQQLESEGLYHPTLPLLEIDGKKFMKTGPIMRYLSASLDGQYQGSTAEENYYLDMVADSTEDYFMSFVNAFKSSDQQVKTTHKEVETPKWINILEKYYADHQGPYLLGEKITYTDILVYHALDDDQALSRLADAPHLTEFVNAFQNRPNIKAYLESLKN